MNVSNMPNTYIFLADDPKMGTYQRFRLGVASFMAKMGSYPQEMVTGIADHLILGDEVEGVCVRRSPLVAHGVMVFHRFRTGIWPCTIRSSDTSPMNK